VLHFDAANVEAIASLASHHFYTDQPEVALRFYRRLVQMGINNTELWNNLGLCCFYASQYDYTVCVCVCVACAASTPRSRPYRRTQCVTRSYCSLMFYSMNVVLFLYGGSINQYCFSLDC
jgi:hypothetical protein